MRALAPVTVALLVLGGCRPPAKPAPVPAALAEDAGSLAPTVALCVHKVPASLCTRCNPELAPVFQEQGDWCALHQVPKSQCLECDPTLRFLAPEAPRDWCKEHGVPESMCTRCNPKLVARFIAASDFCREHGLPQSVCPRCNPGLSLPGAKAAAVRVRLASPETAREAGLQTLKLQPRPFGRTLEVSGQLELDANRQAQLSARTEAVVLEVRVDVGDAVKAGQPLVWLASASVGAEQAQLPSARARLSTAKAALERALGLSEKGVVSLQKLEEAQAEAVQAQAALEAAQAALRLSGEGGSQGRYALFSPVSGVVVSRDALAGRSVLPGQVLLEVADPSSLWARLDVPGAQAASVQAGQSVRLRLEEGGQTLSSTLTRVAPTVDSLSHSVRAWARVKNPDGALKAGAFVRATVALAAERPSLLVPVVAVQRAEGKRLVFVRTQEGQYQPVEVTLGAQSGQWVEVTDGLSAGDEVVTTGAFLLKTEVLKDSIGAGCCEEGE